MQFMKGSPISNDPSGPFSRAGQTGIFSRVVFHTFNRLLGRFEGKSESKTLIRLLFLSGFCFTFFVFSLIFSPADFLLVFLDRGYEQPSIIYAKDHDGNDVEIAEFYRFSRRVIHLNFPADLNAKIVRCYLSTEDSNFFGHFGIDVRGIMRAAFVNLLAGRIKEGASTITQQTARLRFLSNRRSLFRKAREAVLALILEMRSSKKEILEIYFNEVPLGHGTLGVEGAAQFYFDKDVRNLSWGEAAVITALTTRPSGFSPLRSVDQSRKKVRVVFRKLIENGELSVDNATREYHTLETDYYATLNRSPNESAFSKRLNLHPYVTEYIRYLIPEKYRDRLLTGGLKIYTTIQIDHQEAAEKIFEAYLRELSYQKRKPPFRHFDDFDRQYGKAYHILQEVFGIPEFEVRATREERKFQREFIASLRDELSLLNLLAGNNNVEEGLRHHMTHETTVVEEQLSVEGSLVSLRPDTGAITAVIGGSGFASSNQQLRFLTSRRQPGSSFKPFVYAAGIENTGLHPDTPTPLTAATLRDDTPQQFLASDLSEYSPENYSGEFEGAMRLRKALALSKNSIAVGIYDYLGPGVVNPLVEQLLSKPPKTLPRDATVAIGSYALTTYEMAKAYGAFASGGYEIEPYLISKIVDAHGRALEDYEARQKKAKRKRVLSEETAAIITDMMRDVVREGTGRGANLPGREVAGKTGTTNRNTDAWFVGYTPLLVTALHIGYDYVRSLGAHSTGGSIAAPVWGRYMNRALAHESPAHFVMPEGVVSAEICELSGKRPGEQCTKTRIEYFLKGTVPEEICNDHAPSGDQIPLKKPEELFSESDYR